MCNCDEKHLEKEPFNPNTPYRTHMSLAYEPGDTHKPKRIYMGGLILGANALHVHDFLLL